MEWYKRFLQKNGIIGLFMTVVAVVYILLILVQGTIGDSFDAVYKAITLPVHMPTFAENPWTLLTYWMVTPPLWIWILLVDMVLIYTFGNILNAMVGDKRTQGILFFAILVNAIATITLVNVLPTVEASEHAPLFGLHSVNAALIAACITLVPRYEFRIIRTHVPLLYIGAGMLVIMSLSYRLIWTTMGVSILVGALVGFIWIKVMQNGTDLTSWLQFNIGFEAQGSNVTRGVPRERIRVVQSNLRTKEKKKEPEVSDQERLDRLLDRIGEVGYDNLSRKEKEELRRLSGE